MASPGLARSPRSAGEVEKRDAGGGAEGEVRRSSSDAFSPVSVAPASPNSSGHAPCMGSGSAKMGREVGPRDGWSFYLEMQNLGPQQLFPLHLRFIVQKALVFLEGLLHVSGRGGVVAGAQSCLAAACSISMSPEKMDSGCFPGT